MHRRSTLKNVFRGNSQICATTQEFRPKFDDGLQSSASASRHSRKLKLLADASARPAASACQGRRRPADTTGRPARSARNYPPSQAAKTSHAVAGFHEDRDGVIFRPAAGVDLFRSGCLAKKSL